MMATTEAIPESVIAALEEVRAEGSTNMLDREAVLLHLLEHRRVVACRHCHHAYRSWVQRGGSEERSRWRVRDWSSTHSGRRRDAVLSSRRSASTTRRQSRSRSVPRPGAEERKRGEACRATTI